MNFEQEILKVQDTLVVMAEIQRRQAEVQKIQAEELDAVRERMTTFHEKMLAGYELHEKRMAHIEQNLDEISDKLNGLIGFMDGFTRRPPQ